MELCFKPRHSSTGCAHPKQGLNRCYKAPAGFCSRDTCYVNILLCNNREYQALLHFANNCNSPKCVEWESIYIKFSFLCSCTLDYKPSRAGIMSNLLITVSTLLYPMHVKMATRKLYIFIQANLKKCVKTAAYFQGLFPTIPMIVSNSLLFPIWSKKELKYLWIFSSNEKFA